MSKKFAAKQVSGLVRVNSEEPVTSYRKSTYHTESSEFPIYKEDIQYVYGLLRKVSIASTHLENEKQLEMLGRSGLPADYVPNFKGGVKDGNARKMKQIMEALVKQRYIRDTKYYAHLKKIHSKDGSTFWSDDSPEKLSDEELQQITVTCSSIQKIWEDPKNRKIRTAKMQEKINSGKRKQEEIESSEPDEDDEETSHKSKKQKLESVNEHKIQDDDASDYDEEDDQVVEHFGNDPDEESDYDE